MGNRTVIVFDVYKKFLYFGTRNDKTFLLLNNEIDIFMRYFSSLYCHGKGESVPDLVENSQRANRVVTYNQFQLKRNTELIETQTESHK